MLVINLENLTSDEKELLKDSIRDMCETWYKKHPNGTVLCGAPSNLEWMYHVLDMPIPPIVLELLQKYPSSLGIEFATCRDLRGQ
jgi:hypothetical protein